MTIFLYRPPLAPSVMSTLVQANDSSDIEIELTNSEAGYSYKKIARNRYFVAMTVPMTF